MSEFVDAVLRLLSVVVQLLPEIRDAVRAWAAGEDSDDPVYVRVREIFGDEDDLDRFVSEHKN